MKVILTLSTFSIFIFYKYLELLSPEFLAEDLPGHIELTKKLIEHKQLFFFDKRWFTGWPVFQFYGFVPHLVAALLSFITKDVELSIRLIMLFASCLIPFSFYFALNTKNNIFAALLSGLFSLYFLNLDYAFYGIGISSLFSVGLFSQVFGWHSILTALGMLARKNKYLNLIIAITFLSHTLSAAFILLVAIIWFFINSDYRKYISYSIGSGLALISFWLYPYLKYSAEFTNVDDYTVSKDWLNLLFKYPIFELSISRFLNNQIELFNLFFIVVCCLMLLFWYRLKDNYYRNIIISLFCLTIITSSTYLISSNFISMHYYRLSGMTLILALVCIALFLIYFGAKNKFTTLTTSLLLIFATYNLENTKIKKQSLNKSLIKTAHYLRNKDSRVFIEYNTNYKRIKNNSAHYLESNLGHTEVTNGLFVESANINRYLSFSADKLEGNNFHGYLMFVNGSDINKLDAIEQLRSFAVNKVITSSKRFTNSLRNLLGDPEQIIEPYNIFNISPSSGKLEKINKTTIAYLDLEKKLPFSYVSQYFYSRKKLFNNFELIKIDNKINFNPDYILINGDKEKITSYLKENKLKSKVIAFSKSAEIKIKKDRTDYPPDNKVEISRDTRNFFSNVLKLEEKLLSNSKANDKLNLEWLDNKINLKDLKANSLYKINYSYSPLLKSKDLELYRSGQERIIAYAKKSGSFEISYSIMNTPYYISSILLSIVSLVFILFRVKNNSKRSKHS